jgi:PAS domain S-box-containing protein
MSTILVVDDQPDMREALALILGDAGFNVRQAGTGEEALRLAASLLPRLVLLDVVLPDLEGYEVCRRLKADPATATILVLLLSGLGVWTRDRVVGLECGADGYLAKPVDPDELVAQARALLRLRHAEEALARDALLLASVREAVVVTDPEGVITSWNEGATRLLGWSAEEQLGRLLVERLPEHLRAWVSEMLGAVAAGGKWEGEHQEHCRDGSRVWVEARASPIRDPSGRLVGILALAHDVSGRKQAEAERELLISQLQEALATVKTLRGLLPICAWCKQVRNDAGYWRRLEAHLQEHLDVRFTHGICPSCAAKLLHGPVCR